MEIPKEIIEKAIEGGWKSGEQVHINSYATKGPAISIGDRTDPKEFLKNGEIALDPTFWQALGKSLGWFGDKSPLHRYEKSPGVWADPMWIINAKLFYDLILQGKDTTEFWEALLDTNSDA